MPDTKFPIRGSACLAALKTAVTAEQQILGLNPHITRARTEALLDETPYQTGPASDPSGATSMEQEFL